MSLTAVDMQAKQPDTTWEPRPVIPKGELMRKKIGLCKQNAIKVLNEIDIPSKVNRKGIVSHR